MTYEVFIADNIDESIRAILHDYWDVDEKSGSFKNKPSQICTEHLVTDGDLKYFLKSHSSCTISYGKCDGCQAEFSIVVRSQASFSRHFRINRSTCRDCEARHFKELEARRGKDEKSFAQNSSGLKSLDQRVEMLDDEEKEILKSIVKLNDRNAVFKLLFSGGSDSHVKHIFEILGRLEKLSLIRLIRSSRLRIEEIRFDRGLEPILLGDQAEELLHSLVIDLDSDQKKKQESDPDYCGVFSTPRQISLLANTQYLYRAWRRADGKLHLKIEAEGNLEQRQSTKSGNFSGDPISLNDLLHKKYLDNTPEGNFDLEFGERVQNDSDDTSPQD